LFTYKGKSFWIRKFKKDPITVGWENRPHTEESIKITCRGGGKDLILDLIDQAIDFSIEQDQGLLGIYQVDEDWGIW
jgi:hypothetical protein